MIFAGLPLNVLLAAFGAVGAAVVVLYILKLRRRVVAVPFSPLWHRILRDKEATSLFSQLKRLLSLLLQLALLFVLLAALASRPKCTKDIVKSRRIVVLVERERVDAGARRGPRRGAAAVAPRGGEAEAPRHGARAERRREDAHREDGRDGHAARPDDRRTWPTSSAWWPGQITPTEMRADFPRALHASPSTRSATSRARRPPRRGERGRRRARGDRGPLGRQAHRPSHRRRPRGRARQDHRLVRSGRAPEDPRQGRQASRAPRLYPVRIERRELRDHAVLGA